ncbi:CHAT domain-containing protein [Bacteroides sp. 224]|uniref:CHAT domain-containing protein n=1 Tax=Bacteroides sp. 224 TaxID=2302936 RepID=UPI0013D8E020|nr:CHAT domain-containing protein [Bacteroides sp. 224]NDV66937.1 CHAT domain-containing protein [Bacteroides sp. 224]
MRTQQIICFCFFILITCFSWGQDIKQLNQEAAELIEKEEFKKAEEILKGIITSVSQKGVAQSQEYATTLYHAANLYFIVGNYPVAKEYLLQAMKIIQKKNNENNIEYAKYLHLLGEISAETSDYLNAKDYLELAASIREKISGKNSFEYAETISLLGVLCIYGGNLEKGKSLLEQAVAITSKAPDRDMLLYAKTLQNMAGYYLYSYQIDLSEELHKKAINISLKLKGENSVRYAYDLLAASSVAITQAKADDAIHFLSKAHKIYKEKLPDSPHLFMLYSNYSDAYKLKGDYIKAEAILTEAVNHIRHLKKQTEIVSYPYYLQTLATIYTKLGKSDKIEPILFEGIEVSEKVLGKDHVITVSFLHFLAQFYFGLGNFQKAKDLFIQECEIAKKNNYQTNYIRALKGIGMVHYQINEYEKAMEYYQEAINACKYFGEHNFESLQVLEDITSLIHEIQIYSNDIILDTESIKDIHTLILSQYRSQFGENSIEYSMKLNDYGLYLGYQQEYEKSIKLLQKSLSILENIPGIHRKTFTATATTNLAVTMDAANYSKEQIYTLFDKVLNYLKEAANLNFSFLSEKEREIFWSTQMNKINLIKKFPYQSPDSNFGELSYNNELFIKNILLTSSNQVQNAIYNSQDIELIKTWEQFKKYKENADITTNNATEDVLSLEKTIMHKSKQYIDLKEQFNYNWRDIQKALKNGQTAIEFVYFDDNSQETPQTIYYALLIRPDYTSPRLIPCCNEEELKKQLEKPYENDSLYTLVWSPIENQLMNAKEIFIAPTRLMNRIAFCGLTDHSHRSLVDKYSIRQVMSTKDVITLNAGKNTENSLKSIALFGGSDYDLSNKEMTQLYAELKEQQQNKELMRSVIIEEGINRGRGFDYLPGSKKEVETIGGILSNQQWNVSLYTDKQATEAHFKHLSSQSPAVIHISTHGFYFPLVEKKENQKNNIYKISENPLIRSGLLFTGANNMWNSPETVTDQPEDGILTAYEISNMNLTNTQLAVLSACNTGKGEILNNEGTYGLQRAFRLAGVQSMIITLWEISDSDTVIFMTAFYKNWTKGASLREAFITAQKKLKNTYPDQVEKWAGFVLVE